MLNSCCLWLSLLRLLLFAKPKICIKRNWIENLLSIRIQFDRRITRTTVELALQFALLGGYPNRGNTKRSGVSFHLKLKSNKKYQFDVQKKLNYHLIVSNLIELFSVFRCFVTVYLNSFVCPRGSGATECYLRKLPPRSSIQFVPENFIHRV